MWTNILSSSVHTSKSHHQCSAVPRELLAWAVVDILGCDWVIGHLSMSSRHSDSWSTPQDGQFILARPPLTSAFLSNFTCTQKPCVNAFTDNSWPWAWNRDAKNKHPEVTFEVIDRRRLVSGWARQNSLHLRGAQWHTRPESGGFRYWFILRSQLTLLTLRKWLEH